MSKIKSIKAREVLDSRGNPTVEVELITEYGLFRAMVPSGASAGSHEAVELRDNEKRYLGKGVKKAVENVNSIIAPKLIGLECNPHEIDKLLVELDGTENKSHLGANAILPVSIACVRASAAAESMPVYRYIGKLMGIEPEVMPIPQLNIINGGKHAGQENDIQEHMIMPIGAKAFSEAIQMASEIYHELKKLLKQKFGARGILIGDEGGFVPELKRVEDRLGLLEQAIEIAGYKDKIMFAIDAASSEFYYEGCYTIGDKTYSSGELIDFYNNLVDSYPIASLEDGMAEDDWNGWIELTKKLGNKIQIVGDDLLVTNPKRIRKAISLNAANSVLIKVNQIGTITETLEAIKIAHNHNWTTVISHRSGETEDSFIADLAVGVNSGQCKFGAPARSDRNAKYNQLLRIEEELENPKYGKDGEEKWIKLF